MRRKLERRIFLLDVITLQIKNHLNQLTPIGKLPPELLEEVFKHHVAHCIANYEDGSSCANMSWIQISHVCAHWRSVALGCPQLWLRVVVTSNPNPAWIRELLRRSKGMPISVAADIATHVTSTRQVPNARIETLKRLLCNESPRLREIRISAPLHSVRGLLKSIGKPAPYLTSIVVRESGTYWCIAGPSMLKTLPADSSQTLQRLELVDLPFSWDSLASFVALRHLKIVRPGYMDKPLMRGVFDALEKLPLLQSLDLDNALPALSERFDGLPVASRIVNLPDLQCVRLNAGTIDCANFLDRLSFSPDATIACFCTDARGAAYLGAALAAQLSQAAPLRTMSMQIDEYARLRFFDTEVPLESSRRMSKLDITLQTKQIEGSVLDWALAICNALSLPAVRTLEVSLIRTELGSVARWVEIFGGMKELATLRVCGPSRGRLPEILRLRMPDDAARESPFLFPRLKVLEVDSLRVRNEEKYGDDVAGFTQDLRASLDERRANGIGIHRLAVLQWISTWVDNHFMLIKLLKSSVPSIFKADGRGRLMEVKTEDAGGDDVVSSHVPASTSITGTE